MNTPLVIRSFGAVSAAGWHAADLIEAVTTQRVIPTQIAPRNTGARDWECHFRPVPAPPADRVPKHPRLRRVSNITRFAVAAAEEAMRGQKASSLGIVMCLTNGCVAFTNRFYNEVIDTPTLASPMLFPETVFNAPASHIAAYLGVSGPVSTLIGDSSLLCEGIALASDWLHAGLVEQCLLIGAEEADWLSTEALSHYDRAMIATEGAGALLLALDGPGPRIESIAGPFAYPTHRARRKALADLAAATAMPADAVLIDSAIGVVRFDKDEHAAWQGHAQRLSPGVVLGEGMGCKAALQMVLAAGLERPVIVSMPGTNTAAYACVIRV